MISGVLLHLLYFFCHCGQRMEELSHILAKYGPGVVYGSNTVQSLIHDMVSNDHSALIRVFPTLVNPSKESRQYPNDEFIELDSFRDLLMKNINYTLTQEKVELPKIITEDESDLDSPAFIIYKTFLPIIEKVTEKRVEPIKKVINHLTNMLSRSNTTDNWDIPLITNKILMWMSSILEKQISGEIVEQIILLWIRFIESTRRSEYIFRLALSWFKSSVHNVKVDTDRLIEIMQANIKQVTFSSFHHLYTRTMFIHDLYFGDCEKPKLLKDFRHRRVAAFNGFMYIADPTTGLTKFGTGEYGTIFASNEVSSKICVNCDVNSLCICNNHLLLKFQSLSKGNIEVLTLDSLESIGSLEYDGTIPNGPFTACGNNLYIISDSVLYCYVKDGLRLTFQFSTQLVRPNSEDFPVPLPKNYENYVTLISDGSVIGIIFSHHLVGNSYVLYHEYDIKKGELKLDTEQKLQGSIDSIYVAVDVTANVFIEAPYWSPIKVTKLASVYSFTKQYPMDMYKTNNTEIVPLRLMYSLLPLTASNISSEVVDYTIQFAIKSNVLLLQLIDAMYKDERYLVFADVTVSLLALYDYQILNSTYADVDTVISILSLQKVSPLSRINFMKSFVRGNHKFVLITSVCEKMISLLSEYEVVQVFADGFYDKYGFLMAILDENEQRVLNYVRNNVSDLYGFMNSLTTTSLRGVFVLENISCSAIVPIFRCLENASHTILPTLLSPLLPVLNKMLENVSIVSVLFKHLSPILSSTGALCSPKNLTEFSKKHNDNRIGKNINEKVIIEESSHPYENNIEYVHSYNFPAAISIKITFDEKTDTEHNRDTLQIFSDPNCTEAIVKEMSGKFPNWVSPIHVNCQHLSFKFKSDPSVNAYGYKAYIHVVSISNIHLYQSPYIYYDLSRALFLALLKVAYSFYSPPDGYEQWMFSFPKNLKEIPYCYEDSIRCIQQICDKWNEEDCTPYFENFFRPESSFKKLYSYLCYIRDNVDPSVEVDMYALIQHSTMLPLVCEAEPVDTNRLFTLIGSLLMLNTLGLHGDLYKFLFVALKDSKTGHEFALSSFMSVGEICSSSNSPDIIAAAAKIQIGLSVIGPRILDEYHDIISKFLNAYKDLVIPVTAQSKLKTNEKIPWIFEDFVNQISSTSKFFDSVIENLIQIVPIGPHSVNPFVLFSLNIADTLSPSPENEKFVLRVILQSMMFQTTQIIQYIQSILSKRSFKTSIDQNPEIIDILRSIGDGMRINVTVSKDLELYDNGPSFSLSRAEIIRSIYDHSKLDNLIDIIRRNDYASLGALLVLGASNFHPHVHQQVVMKSDGRKVTIYSMDYIQYCFLNDDGLSFSAPAIDATTFKYNSLPFYPVQPERFGKVNPLLVDIVFQASINGSFKLESLSALAELTHSNPLPLELAKTFRDYSVKKEVKSSKPKLIKRKFLEGEYFVSEEPIQMYSIQAKYNMSFGFCNGKSDTIYNNFVVTVTQYKDLVFPSSLSIPLLKLESENVTIGHFGSYKQLFIATGDSFTTPPVYLSCFDDVSALVIYDNDNFGFNMEPYIPPFLIKQLLPISSSFTHASVNNKLVSILKENVHFNAATLSYIHFLPILSKHTKRTYLEFNVTAESIEVNIHPETIRAKSYFKYTVTSLYETSTYGLAILVEDSVAYMTKDGKIIDNSITYININHDFTVSLELDRPAVLSVNSGYLPFVFDINSNVYSNPSKSKSHTIKEQLPHTFSTVYTGELPFNLNLVSGYTQEIADVSLERPCILTAPDIDTNLYYQTGVFTRIPNTDKVHIKMFNSKVQTWMDFELVDTAIYSITDSLSVDNVFAAHERLQRSVKPFLCSSLYFDSQNDTYTPILTSARKREFFDNLECVYKCLIYTSSVIHSITKFGDDDLIDYAKEAALILGEDDFVGRCTERLVPLFSALVTKRRNVFISLLRQSIDSLFYIENLEPIILSHRDTSFEEVERRKADAIYVRIDDDCCLPLTIFSDSSRDPLHFSKNSDMDCLLQCTIDGDIVTVSDVSKDELLFFNILPIFLNQYNSKHCYRLCLHLVSFVIDHCNEFNLESDVNQIVLLPILRRIMNKDYILFGQVVSRWLLGAIDKDIIVNKDQYIKIISLQVLKSIRDPQLFFPVTLFCMHIYISSDREEIIINNLINLIEPFFNDESSYTSMIFTKIAADLLGPYQTYDSGPLSRIKKPLMSSFAYKAYVDSLFSESIEKLEPVDDDSLYHEYLIDTRNCDLIFIKNFGSAKIYDSNENELTEFFVPEGDEYEIAVERTESTKDVTVELILRKSAPRPSTIDFIRIFKLHNTIMTNWSIRDEVYANALALILKDAHSLFCIDDSEFSFMFQEELIPVARFRVSTLILLSRTQRSYEITTSSQVNRYMRMFLPVIVERGDLKKQEVSGYPPISIVSLSNFYERAALQFSAYTCFTYYPFVHSINLLNVGYPTTILHVVRHAKNDLFEAPVWREDSALLPKSTLDTTENLTEFLAFGFHMAVNLIHKASLPLPVSRVVIRYAFGGKIIPDDFHDIDPDFAASSPSDEAMKKHIESILCQLKAIRCGTSMALNGNSFFNVDSPIFPRMMQLLPLTIPSSVEDKMISPLRIPYIRDQMFEQKVTLLKKEDRTDVINKIID